GMKIKTRPSPDGRWIAFWIIDEKGLNPYLMRPDGRGAHPLSADFPGRFEFVMAESWSPDGSRLACFFVGRGTSGSGLVSRDREAGTARAVGPLDRPGALDDFPAGPPAGPPLAYEALSDESWDLWLAAGDGGPPRRLTSDPGNERSATWSA